MSFEILYTSAQQGLKQGSIGFCTVLATRGIPVNLISRMEMLSGYRHLYQPQDASAAQNPVAWSHTKVGVSGQPVSVLSRVAAYGSDYSGRTNKLAHHVALSAAELSAAGPAWLLQQQGLMRTAWDGQCQTPDAGPAVPMANQAAMICRGWERLTGDAGWAGAVAESILKPGGRPIWVIYKLQHQTHLLSLVGELISLMSPTDRWNATFSTYFTTLPPEVDCRLRFVVEGTKEAAEVARTSPIILGTNLGPAPASRWADAARTGQTIEPSHAASAIVPTKSAGVVRPQVGMRPVPPALVSSAQVPPPVLESRVNPPWTDTELLPQVPAVTNGSGAKFPYVAACAVLVLLISGVLGYVVFKSKGSVVAVASDGAVTVSPLPANPVEEDLQKQAQQEPSGKSNETPASSTDSKPEEESKSRLDAPGSNANKKTTNVDNVDNKEDMPTVDAQEPRAPAEDSPTTQGNPSIAAGANDATPNEGAMNAPSKTNGEYETQNKDKVSSTESLDSKPDLPRKSFEEDLSSAETLVTVDGNLTRNKIYEGALESHFSFQVNTDIQPETANVLRHFSLDKAEMQKRNLSWEKAGPNKTGNGLLTLSLPLANGGALLKLDRSGKLVNGRLFIKKKEPETSQELKEFLLRFQKIEGLVDDLYVHLNTTINKGQPVGIAYKKTTKPQEKLEQFEALSKSARDEWDKVISTKKSLEAARESLRANNKDLDSNQTEALRDSIQKEKVLKPILTILLEIDENMSVIKHGFLLDVGTIESFGRHADSNGNEPVSLERVKLKLKIVLN